MNDQQAKEISRRLVLYKWYVGSTWAHPSVNYDSLKNSERILNGVKDEVTGVIFRSGVLDTQVYPHLEVRHIIEVVADMDMSGYLEHVTAPQVIERIVEVERKPTAEEIAKAKKEKFQKEHSHGFHGGGKNNKTELDRDDQFNRPVLLEHEKQAINERNRQIDAIVLETMSKISNYSSYTHSKTYSRRDELTALFNQHKNKVNDIASAEKLARTVAEKIDSYDRGTSGSIR